jgi:hypothetical protein
MVDTTRAVFGAMDTTTTRVANYIMDTIIIKDTVTIKINAIKQEKANMAIAVKITTTLAEDKVLSPMGMMPIGVSFSKIKLL